MVFHCRSDRMSFHVHLYVVICHQHITKYTQMFGFGPTYARGIAMLNHSGSTRGGMGRMCRRTLTKIYVLIHFLQIGVGERVPFSQN